MTYTDDNYTIRIPRFTGWRTLAVNALFVLAGSWLILATTHAEAGAAVALVAFVNIVMRLCTRSRVARSVDVFGAMWSSGQAKLVTPKRADDQLVATLSAQANAVRPVLPEGEQLMTELAVLLDTPAKPVRRYDSLQEALDAAAARMARAPRMDDACRYAASTVALAGLTAFGASFLSTLAVMAL